MLLDKTGKDLLGMKKNIILFVLDGVSYFNVGSSQNRNSPTPYIDSLRDKSIWATKCYSQGPFTEAGVIGLLFGQDTMNDGGYFLNTLVSEQNLIHLAHKSGYKTFLPNLTYFIPPSCVSFSEYASYSNRYDSSVFVYKFQYYANLYKNSYLNDVDVALLIKMLEVLFVSLQIELHPDTLRKNYTLNNYPFKESTSGKEKEGFLVEVSRQYAEFNKNRKQYLFNFLKDLSLNPVFPKESNRPKYFKNEILEQKTWVFETFKDFYKEPRDKNNLNYFKGSITNLKRATKRLLSLLCRNILQGQYCEINARMISGNPGCSAFCFVPSAQTYIDALKNWMMKNVEDGIPSFAYIHFEDTHYPWSFYTTDTTDKEKIREEFALLSQYKSKLPKNYNGEINVDYACLYVDNCIRNFIAFLEKTGEIDNTIVVITADHGISNAGKVQRKERNNNFFDETYHIPFIIYNPKIAPRMIESFTTNKDIAATILDLGDINKPKSFSGVSVFDKNFPQRTYTTMEYIGFGMPDMQRRPITFAYRDDEFNVVYSAMINDEFDKGKIIELYDLKNDPMELANLVDLIMCNQEVVIEKIKNLKRRFYELRENYINWINKYRI